MGMVCLNSLIVKSCEKLYFRPNSVYWAAVTRFCKTSRCASIGLFFQASMRHMRMRARDDMAGERSLIHQQDRKERGYKMFNIQFSIFNVQALIIEHLAMHIENLSLLTPNAGLSLLRVNNPSFSIQNFFPGIVFLLLHH